MKYTALVILLAILLPKRIITTIAGGGKGSARPVAGYLSGPNQVTLDGTGAIYVADCKTQTVKRINKDGSIRVVAGDGEARYNGDGGPALKASMQYPLDVAFDKAGNMYIADGGNHRIRKVDRAGRISTIAGTGQQGHTGDGGPAVKATFNFPIALAIDRQGNILVAERHNHCIRKITPAGTISTFAGTGSEGYSGDGGPAARAQINEPTDVAVDGNNNVYIADLANHRIRKVSSSGQISTFAGTGFDGYSEDGTMATACRMSYPYGVFADDKGNVYYSDNHNALIRMVNAKGVVSTLAGTPGIADYTGDGGLAIKARIFDPGGIAVDKDGTLFFADFGNNAVRRVK